jgi:hypothetical protein
MLDLQKAFDTVDHEILFIKLRAMGFNFLGLGGSIGKFGLALTT